MRTIDDRGTRVKLIPHRKLGVLPGIPSPIPMEVRRRMYAAGQEVQWSREVLIPLVIGLLVLAMWGLLWVYLGPRLSAWLTVPPLLKGLILGILPPAPLPLLLYVLIRAGRHRMARVVIRHGYCASCGYALAGLEPAPDGCTICPECGSAWKLPPAVNSSVTAKP